MLNELKCGLEQDPGLSTEHRTDCCGDMGKHRNRDAWWLVNCISRKKDVNAVFEFCF